MKRLEFYFGAPDYRGPDPKLQWEPTPFEWAYDFKSVLNSSGYTVEKAVIKQEKNPDSVGRKIEVTVEGWKQ
jgi:hypothetical protein